MGARKGRAKSKRGKILSQRPAIGGNEKP